MMNRARCHEQSFFVLKRYCEFFHHIFANSVEIEIANSKNWFAAGRALLTGWVGLSAQTDEMTQYQSHTAMIYCCLAFVHRRMGSNNFGGTRFLARISRSRRSDDPIQTDFIYFINVVNGSVWFFSVEFLHLSELKPRRGSKFIR